MKEKDFSERILVGITGTKENDWKDKLKEIERFKINKVALFLESFKKNQREKIYSALLNSKIKEIPLAHIRNDMEKEEMVFLKNNFGSYCLTIHESGFKLMEKWKGFHKDLYLEMNADNFVSQLVEVERIGGFCVDLSHFKIGIASWNKEFAYIFERRKTSHYFDCNHLNGYDPEANSDMHWVKSLKDFDYLETLPKFLFGDIIAIEVYNSITEQLKFKKYLSKVLKKIL